MATKRKTTRIEHLGLVATTVTNHLRSTVETGEHEKVYRLF